MANQIEPAAGGTQERNERIEWVDLARAVATLCIVAVHSVGEAYTFDPAHMSQLDVVHQIIYFSIFTVGRMGVPLFFLISGYLLLGRDFDDETCRGFWRRNLVPLLLTTEIWIVAYELFYAWYLGTSFDMAALVRSMLFLDDAAGPHLWYMPVILGTYLFLPLVTAALRKFSARTLAVLLAVAVVCLYVVPTVNVLLDILGQDAIFSLLDVNFGGGTYGTMLLLGYSFRVVGGGVAQTFRGIGAWSRQRMGRRWCSALPSRCGCRSLPAPMTTRTTSGTAASSS